MKLHQGVIHERGGVRVTKTMCGRENAKSTDGMNIAERPEDVTCKFCLKLRARRPIRRTPTAHHYFDGRVVPINL